MTKKNIMIDNIHKLGYYSQAIVLEHSSLKIIKQDTKADVILEKAIVILMSNPINFEINLQKLILERGYNSSDNIELGLSFNRYLFDDCLKYLEKNKNYMVTKKLRKYKLLNEKEVTKLIDISNQTKEKPIIKKLTR